MTFWAEDKMNVPDDSTREEPFLTTQRFHFVPMPYGFNVEQSWQPRPWDEIPPGMAVHVAATGAVRPRADDKDEGYGYVIRNVETGETSLFYSKALFVNRVKNWRSQYPQLKSLT